MPDQFDQFIDDVLEQPEPAPRKPVERDKYIRTTLVPLYTTPMVILSGKKMARFLPAVSAVRGPAAAGILDDVPCGERLPDQPASRRRRRIPDNLLCALVGS